MIPLLDEINPWFVPRMADTIRYLRSDNDYLSAQAAAVARRARPAGDGGLSISAALLASQPDPIAVRIVSCLLGRLGEFQFRAAHLTAVVALSRSPSPSGAVSLPHSLTARRVYGELILVRGARRSPSFGACFPVRSRRGGPALHRLDHCLPAGPRHRNSRPIPQTTSFSIPPV